MSNEQVKPQMVHWDTLQEQEDSCVCDNGGTQMVRDDGAVFLYVRADLLAGPDLLRQLQVMTDYLEESHQYEIQTGHGGDDLKEMPCSYCLEIAKARALIALVKGEQS